MMMMDVGVEFILLYMFVCFCVPFILSMWMMNDWWLLELLGLSSVVGI